MGVYNWVIIFNIRVGLELKIFNLNSIWIGFGEGVDDLSLTEIQFKIFLYYL